MALGYLSPPAGHEKHYTNTSTRPEGAECYSRMTSKYHRILVHSKTKKNYKYMQHNNDTAQSKKEIAR